MKNTDKPMMAFTFDDGPVGTADTATSIRIQNALAASKQNATFFYWGSRINASTETEIRRAFEMGFEIGIYHFPPSPSTVPRIVAAQLL